MKSIIVLEALDGVGKSTVAKLVAKKLNAVVYRPSGRIKHATNEAIKLPYGSQERSGAIRNTLTMMSKEIKEVAQAYPVILDRFYASWASAEVGSWKSQNHRPFNGKLAKRPHQTRPQRAPSSR